MGIGNSRGRDQESSRVPRFWSLTSHVEDGLTDISCYLCTEPATGQSVRVGLMIGGANLLPNQMLKCLTGTATATTAVSLALTVTSHFKSSSNILADHFTQLKKYRGTNKSTFYYLKEN